MADIKEMLTRKLGPLPAWAWVLAGAGVGYLALRRKGKTPTSALGSLVPNAGGLLGSGGGAAGMSSDGGAGGGSGGLQGGVTSGGHGLDCGPGGTYNAALNVCIPNVQNITPPVTIITPPPPNPVQTPPDCGPQGTWNPVFRMCFPNLPPVFTPPVNSGGNGNLNQQHPNCGPTGYWDVVTQRCYSIGGGGGSGVGLSGAGGCQPGYARSAFSGNCVPLIG